MNTIPSSPASPASPASPGNDGHHVTVGQGVATFCLCVVVGILVAGGAPPRSVSVHVGERECIERSECEEQGGEIDTREIGALVGPGYVDSFAVNCLRTAATLIQAPCGQVSYEAQVPAAATANVVFGDDDITASAGGIVRAAGETNGGNVRYEYCRTTLDAGVSINVRALCSSAP